MGHDYFKTTDIEGKILRMQIEKAKSQRVMVQSLFAHYKTPMTASDVWKRLGKPSIPIWSIRRAMTVCKNKGILDKTPKKKIGMYGSHEHFYQLKQNI